MNKGIQEVHLEIQYGDNSISREALIDKAREVWIATGHDPRKVEMIDLYVKPEENRVYYVVNKCETGSFPLF